ncbi:cytochrome b/b6 domain-containing protein [Glutamicibacter creatinolyticus]|uniref:cytochrome b/b6 domain-containing protein n=1 Tax=Glutamicibacter TaxID=1742989 RepID=UPI0032180012
MSTIGKKPSRTGKATPPPWLRPVLTVAAALIVAALVVLLARWLRTLEPVQDFLTRYPGHSTLPQNAPVGFPAWMGWQHFLNMFLIVLIIRSGWQVRSTGRPRTFWTRNNKGLVKTKGTPKKISLELWFHLSLDALWVLNGLVFYILLFVTGQWMRIVPTHWDVFPNALSSALQYASFDWPLENSWTNYNALQMITYFLVVFVAAPLAIITGLRMSNAWPKQARINKAYPIELARAIHLPTMLFFVMFIIVHVVLVFSTGALRNLNHMYAARDDTGWLGLWVFIGSVVVVVAGWLLARPIFLRPIAGLTGKLSR